MKRISILLLLVVVVVATYLFMKGDSDYSEEKFIVPKSARLHLRTTFDEASKPVLALSVYAGSGCDKVSDLKISTAEKESTMSITVEGYSIQEYTGTDTCPAMVAEASAEIEIAEFLEYGGHQVWFQMGGVDSKYDISQEKYTVYLEPTESGNVISHATALVTSSEQFAVLELSGTYRPNIDHTEYLRNVARDNILVPADEVLKGFSQGNNSLWVLAEDSQIPTTTPSIIGEITYDSGGWGMESVDVVIARKQLPQQYSF